MWPFLFHLEKFLNISFKAGLVVLNSFSFSLSVKLLISPSNQNENVARQSILGCRFFSFITLNPATLFWPAGFLLKSQLVALWEFPCMELVAFPLLMLIFTLYFKFLPFQLLCFLVLFGFILFGTLCASWTWMSVYFPRLGMFAAMISSNIFPAFLSFFSFWDPCNANVSMLDVVTEVS